MKIETLLPLNRESRDQDLQSVISCHGSSSKRLDGGGHCGKLAQHRIRSQSLQWLSVMLIVDIRCTDRTPTDRQKCSSLSRFGTVLSRFGAGWTRLSAGYARLCAGYNGRALAGTGASLRVTRVPLWGKRPCHHVVYGFTNFCQKSTVLRPDCRVTSRKTDSYKLFTLVCNRFMLLLSAVSAPKVTVMYPGPQSTVHIHPSRSAEG